MTEPSGAVDVLIWPSELIDRLWPSASWIFTAFSGTISLLDSCVHRLTLSGHGVKAVVYGLLVVIQFTVPRRLSRGVLVIHVGGKLEVLRPKALPEGAMILCGTRG